MAKLYGRWGAYEPRTLGEKAKARRKQKARAEMVAAARDWKEKHRWCLNECGKEAAWYESGQTLLFDGACSQECLAAYQQRTDATPNVRSKWRAACGTSKRLQGAV